MIDHEPMSRIPVLFADSATEVRADDAVLVEGMYGVAVGAVVVHFTLDAGHAARCACCAGRSGAARALSALFLDRGRGKTAFFSRVVVISQTDDGRAAVKRALATDVLVSRWFSSKD